MTASRRPLVIGHRGASGYRPEHTRAAFELAIALGADAVEPDLVTTRDGVLVVRHENEISGTTDVASRPEFADRRTTKRIDGRTLTGWFTEDFTWAELRTLRAVERLPRLRQSSSTFDGMQPVLRLRDLLDLVDAASERLDRTIPLVAEVKHATYFDSLGLPLDELVADELRGWADHDRVVFESFEQTVLGRLRERGMPGRLIFLVEDRGAPADLAARFGRKALPYSAHLTDAGLAGLARDVDGVSVKKSLILRGEGTSDVVDRAHAQGLEVYTWTLRPENRFLAPANRRGTSPRDWGDWRREFGQIIDTGVDGVFADHPDLVRVLIDD